jgi:hypothetical protein
MEEVVLQVLKSISKPFRAGESHTMSSPNTAASIHRVILGAKAVSLGTLNPSYNASVVFPSSLASTLLLPGATTVDVGIHVFQHAPIIADVVPMTPLVSVQLSQSVSGTALNASGLPDGINITLPLTRKVNNYHDLEYECMYWNGSGYSSGGCAATGFKTATSVQCSCNHLTTFIARVRARLHICLHVCIFLFSKPLFMSAFRDLSSIFICNYVGNSSVCFSHCEMPFLSSYLRLDYNYVSFAIHHFLLH